MGSNGQVGQVLLRNVVVQAPPGHSWHPGDDADVRLTLLTDADTSDALIGVRSDSAEHVELRADQDCDGTSPPVDAIPVPPNETAGGSGDIGSDYHLRIIGFTREVLAGTTVALTFDFEKAEDTTIEAMVEANGDGDVFPPACGTPATSTPTTSPSDGQSVLRGRVEAGVEPGCLVLTTDSGQFLLLDGDAQVLRPGTEVVVQGEARPGQATTCQQGTPFTVREVRLAPASR
ncbi:copper chaperone PCu(A)C [Umezawaea sp.]|uniref:copper chaperone PCu(A)C n=1 Tax=Umezawaea sp. TaxID=1955258 RepID=UPI002ED1E8DB